MTEIVAHYHAGNGLIMRAVNSVGGMIEDQMKRLPAAARRTLTVAVEQALMRAFEVCAATEPAGGRRGWTESGAAHRAVAVMSGAVGGFFGPAGLAELPVAVTAMLRSIRSVARDYGYDPDDPQIARECIAVFSAGGPLHDDDGVDSAFVTARMAMTGARLQTLLPRVAVRLAQAMGQKVGTQAVPVLGAVGGATVNYAFMNFYTEMAHVYFGLRRMAETEGTETVMAEFRSHVAHPQRAG